MDQPIVHCMMANCCFNIDELLKKLEKLELHEDQALARYESELVKLLEEWHILLESHCEIDNHADTLVSIR